MYCFPEAIDTIRTSTRKVIQNDDHWIIFRTTYHPIAHFTRSASSPNWA
jgi:hypothetical protein